MLTPKWEELAEKLKHTVKVAYVDTEGGPTPRSLGPIKGTPTIKAFVPKRASARNEKELLEYDSAREVGDLVRFATSRMPSYVERVSNDAELAKFTAKASDWGLPRILVFSDKAAGQTSSTLKAISSEFRRRGLIAEVRKHARTEQIISAHVVSSFPTLVCLGKAGKNGEPLRFEGKQPTYGRLSTFVGKCSLSKPVLTKPSATDKQEL